MQELQLSHAFDLVAWLEQTLVQEQFFAFVDEVTEPLRVLLDFSNLPVPR